MPAGALVIGIGSRDQGDDAAGLLVARLLRRRVPSGVTVVEQDGDGAKVLEALGAADAAIVVDAALSGARPGTIQRWDAVAAPLPQAQLRVSTHAFGVAEAVELARVLGTLPRRCVIFAIEAERFGVGEGISDAVTAAVERAVCAVLAELQEMSEPAHA